jgi:tripartite-type tricarboxylate transporter receptor subunit TctC
MTFLNPSRRRWLAQFGSAALLAAAGGPALAQSGTTRLIHMVVPFGPGAVQDTVARTFSNELGQILGANVVIENRAGAGGTLGTGYVAKSAPDGNTLVLAAASHNLASHLYAKLPYDPVKDFVGVAYLGMTGYVIAVPASLGVNSLAEFVKLAKSKPGQFNYASAGNGSASHLGTASFAAKAGIELQHIPMKSTGDAINELLAGRVQVVTGATIGMLQFRNDARLKLLAYTGNSRSRFIADLPTVAEAGVPGYSFDSWIGVLGPGGTPAAEVDRLNAAIRKAQADPAVQERLSRLGVEAGTLSVAEFQKLLQTDHEQAGSLVKAAGVRVE